MLNGIAALSTSQMPIHVKFKKSRKKSNVNPQLEHRPVFRAPEGHGGNRDSSECIAIFIF
jgi:hypothetical protein